MNPEEFVQAVKIQTSDAAVSGTIALLKRPPGRKPSQRLVRLSDWYSQLDKSNQEFLMEVLKEAADMAVFEFFCILDGVTPIEEGPQKGELELYYVRGGFKTRLNVPEREELHNTFNALSGTDGPSF